MTCYLTESSHTPPPARDHGPQACAWLGWLGLEVPTGATTVPTAPHARSPPVSPKDAVLRGVQVEVGPSVEPEPGRRPISLAVATLEGSSPALLAEAGPSCTRTLISLQSGLACR